MFLFCHVTSRPMCQVTLWVGHLILSLTLLGLGFIGLIEVDIVPIPIPMPRFQCQNLQMAVLNWLNAYNDDIVKSFY